MKVFHTCPQLLTVKQAENGRRQFKPSIALEMVRGSQSCISFATDNSLNIGSSEVEIMADPAPITFPAHLRWVSDPLNERDKGYDPSSFDILTKDGTARSLSTTLLHGMTKVGKKEKQQLLENMASGRSNHPCTMLASTAGVAAYFEGGHNCSIEVEGQGFAPVTFYSNLELQLQIPIMIQNVVTGYLDRLDHFLIPTLMEDSSIVWMAIARQEDPEENRKELDRWNSNNFDVAGFGTLTVQTDELVIRVAFDGRPIKRTSV